MPSHQTVSLTPPSAWVSHTPPAVTNMKNEWLASMRPRPSFSIPFREDEVARGATVLLLDIYHSGSSLTPIEELIDRTAVSRPLGHDEVPLVYEIVRDSSWSVYVIVEVMGPADFILAIADGLVALGLRSMDH